MATLLCFLCAVQFLFIGYLLGKGKRSQGAGSAFKDGAKDSADFAVRAGADSAVKDCAKDGAEGGEKEAFSLLMGYNADVAYGVKQMTEE